MTTILHLPLELIVAILKYLNPFDLQSVLKTDNKTLYGAVDPLLRPYKAWVRNAQLMIALFPPLSTYSTRDLCPSYPSHIPPLNDDCVSLRDQIARQDLKSLALDPKGEPYIRCSPPDLVTWMKLDGTFDWLEPLDEDMAAEMATYNGSEGDHPVAPKRQVNALVKQASKLGLTLPPGFEAFLQSDKMHLRFPSYSAWYFKLSKLIKCPPSIDGGKRGYLCRFHWDQQACAFAYLYLSLCGSHCVLISQIDVYSCLDEDDEGTEAGGDEAEEGNNDAQPMSDREEEEDDNNDEESHEFDKEDFTIAGLSFEEYLVTVYFEGLLSFEAKPFKGLQDFVKHVYRSPAEVEHMRETNSEIRAFLDAQGWKGKEHYRKSLRL